MTSIWIRTGRIGVSVHQSARHITPLIDIQENKDSSPFAKFKYLPFSSVNENEIMIGTICPSTHLRRYVAKDGCACSEYSSVWVCVIPRANKKNAWHDLRKSAAQ